MVPVLGDLHATSALTTGTVLQKVHTGVMADVLSSQYTFVFLVIFDQADALLTVCKSDLVWPLHQIQAISLGLMQSHVSG